MQIVFTLGAIFVTILFYLIPNWRVVMITSVTIPSMIFFALMAGYLEETPQFLVRKGVEPTLKAMNRIGKINFGLRDILEPEDIQNVIEEQMEQKEFQGIITPLDLFKFPSLRKITISCSLVCFAIYGLYYGPVLIISQIGFDIYISSIIVQGSGLASFIPVYFLIETIPRRKSGFFFFAITLTSAVILIFVVKPNDCVICTKSIIELILIFVFRFSISFYFAIFQLYFV